MVVIKLEEKIVIKALYSGKSSCSFYIYTRIRKFVYKKTAVKTRDFSQWSIA